MAKKTPARKKSQPREKHAPSDIPLEDNNPTGLSRSEWALVTWAVSIAMREHGVESLTIDLAGQPRVSLVLKQPPKPAARPVRARRK